MGASIVLAGLAFIGWFGWETFFGSRQPVVFGMSHLHYALNLEVLLDQSSKGLVAGERLPDCCVSLATGEVPQFEHGATAGAGTGQR
jgi:hypothetical protein